MLFSFFQIIAIYISVLHIVMEPVSYTCKTDYLTINGLVGKTDEDEIFCGKVYDVRLRSAGNKILLTFHTDTEGSDYGFKLQYDFYDAEEDPPGPPFTVETTGLKH